MSFIQVPAGGSGGKHGGKRVSAATSATSRRDVGTRRCPRRGTRHSAAPPAQGETRRRAETKKRSARRPMRYNVSKLGSRAGRPPRLPGFLRVHIYQGNDCGSLRGHHFSARSPRRLPPAHSFQDQLKKDAVGVKALAGPRRRRRHVTPGPEAAPDLSFLSGERSAAYLPAYPHHGGR